MPLSVSLRDANQNFAKLVRAVEAGEEFVITRLGQPVAKLSPISGRKVLTKEQEDARRRTRERMRRGWDLGIDRVDRDALYDRAIFDR